MKSGASGDAVRKTAYLDGARGFAAFIVYWQHHELWVHSMPDNIMFQNSFGFGGQYRFATLPGVRLFFTGGHLSVACFFIISGYVLSIKPLSLIQSGDQAKLAENLGSQLFRRWLRLYIPLIATTFFYMLTWHAFGGVWINGLEKQSNMRDEIWSWYTELKNFSFFFDTGGNPFFKYNDHLWSIPIEMKGSIAVFTSTLAFSRLTTKARLWCTVGLIFYFMYIADGAYYSMFMTGVFLADLDLLSAKNELPRFFTRLSPYKKFIFYHVLILALYLGGVPCQGNDISIVQQNRGWYYLSLLKPQAVFDYKWFYLYFAATFIISATPHIFWMKRFFETRFCQYLGRISYALYLVHGPVLRILGDRIYTAVGWGGVNGSNQPENIPGWVNLLVLPRIGPMGLEVAFLLPHLILLPVTFWWAEIVTRCLDEPAVKFSQWLYRSLLATPSSSSSSSSASAPGAGAVSASAPAAISAPILAPAPEISRAFGSSSAGVVAAPLQVSGVAKKLDA